MPTNHTPNYSLSQWERSDQVQMEDFNSDNAKIDAALGRKAEQSVLNALSQTVAGHTAALGGKGNCRIETQSYTGTGKCGADNPTRITFPAMPTFFVVFGGRSVAMGFGGEDYITSITHTSGQSYSFGCSSYNVTWAGNQMTLQSSYMESQLNATNTLYHVVSFYKMDGR